MRLVYSRETERLLEPQQTGIEDAFGAYDDEIEMRTVGKYNPFLNEPDLQIQMMELCPFSRFLLTWSCALLTCFYYIEIVPF